MGESFTHTAREEETDSLSYGERALLTQLGSEGSSSYTMRDLLSQLGRERFTRLARTVVDVVVRGRP